MALSTNKGCVQWLWIEDFGCGTNDQADTAVARCTVQIANLVYLPVEKTNLENV